MLKINGDAYIGNTGVKISELVTRLKTLENLDADNRLIKIERLARCCIQPTGDITVNIPSSWAQVKVPCNTLIENKWCGSTSIAKDGNHIHIYKDGWYLISGSINSETQSDCSGLLYTDKHGYFIINDSGNMRGMVNSHMPSTLKYLKAGDNVYLAYRNGVAGNYLIRGGRSYLSVIEV